MYIGDRNNHRVRGVTAVAEVTPPRPLAADLYGESVAPYAVPRGQAFDLGVRIKNRGPNAVEGRFVTVELNLADGLVGIPDNGDRRLSRTFTGQRLLPHQGSLDGVFHVSAPATVSPGISTSTLKIQYSGEIDLNHSASACP
ncbi:MULTISPECIES: hypothetical protein [unclassified Streptomyces]|uniref:hypothetical protein n=1 Tax=unclassified Streptomyces TaxID=2593676 RepID=UPI00336A1FFF